MKNKGKLDSGENRGGKQFKPKNKEKPIKIRTKIKIQAEKKKRRENNKKKGKTIFFLIN